MSDIFNCENVKKLHALVKGWARSVANFTSEGHVHFMTEKTCTGCYVIYQGNGRVNDDGKYDNILKLLFSSSQAITDRNLKLSRAVEKALKCWKSELF